MNRQTRQPPSASPQQVPGPDAPCTPAIPAAGRDAPERGNTGAAQRAAERASHAPPPGLSPGHRTGGQQSGDDFNSAPTRDIDEHELDDILASANETLAHSKPGASNRVGNAHSSGKNSRAEAQAAEASSDMVSEGGGQSPHIANPSKAAKRH